MSKLNVLMTGAGAPGAPGIIRCLTADKNLNLWVGDANENAVGRHLHPQFVKLPKASEPDFEAKVLQICRENDIQIVFPLVTRELSRFAAVKNEWSAMGINVLVSESEPLEIANNKGLLYQLLKENGIAYPAFQTVENIHDLEKALYDLGFPGKNVVVKPAISNGMRGFRIVSPPENEFALFFSEKAGTPYISVEKLLQTLSAAPIPPMVVCEFLPGPEYTVDCLLDNGMPLLIVPRLRSKMTGGISTEGEVVNDERIIAYCRQILSVLKLNGNIGIQVKEADDGGIKLLEINPRIQGTTVALTGAGLNMAMMAVNLARGLQPADAEMNVRWGTKFTRYWQEVYY